MRSFQSKSCGLDGRDAAALWAFSNLLRTLDCSFWPMNLSTDAQQQSLVRRELLADVGASDVHDGRRVVGRHVVENEVANHLARLLRPDRRDVVAVEHDEVDAPLEVPLVGEHVGIDDVVAMEQRIGALERDVDERECVPTSAACRLRGQREVFTFEVADDRCRVRR